MTRRPQRSLIEAITSTYEKKIFAVWKFLTLSLNQHFLKKLRDEINDNKNRGKTALKSHYQYIRQLDFIQNNFTMFNPLAVQPVMLE